MIPLHDRNAPRTYPIVTRILLAINVALWLYVVYLSRTPGALDSFFGRYAFDWSQFAHAITAGSWSVET